MPQISEPNTKELELPDLPLLDWSDFYANLSHGIPDELSAKELETTESVEKNLRRISYSNLFRSFSVYSDTVAKVPEPGLATPSQDTLQSLYIFKAPYYRVHVGDFSDHCRAYSTSQIIKRQFPDVGCV